MTSGFVHSMLFWSLALTFLHTEAASWRDQSTNVVFDRRELYSMGVSC